MEDSDGVGATLAAIAVAPLIVAAAFWFICAITAAVIAESRGRSAFGFFCVTLFFLGPFGPGFALIAPREFRGTPSAPKALVPVVRPVAEGRRRFSCPRCGAANDIPEAETGYDCWQCSEHRKVRPA